METLTFLMTSSFYPPYHIGGDAIHVKYLAEELVKHGHVVHVMHSLDAYSIKRKDKRKGKVTEDANGVFVHTLKSPLGKADPLRVYMSGNSNFVQREFSRLINEIRPDVVHHHNISLLGYNLLKKQGNYLNLYTAHDFWLICPTSNLLKDKKGLCTKKSCFSCTVKSGRPPQLWRAFKGLKDAIDEIDILIAPSEYLRKRLTEEIDVKSTTIHNFSPRPPKDIPPSGYSNYFLFAGLHEKHKGILDLLKVFKEHRSEIDSKLIIAGTGSLEGYVLEFIKSNDLKEEITFLGFQQHEKLFSLFKDATALILPSIWPENGPLVVLEAMSVGTPSVVTGLGGVKEYVEKVDRGLILDAVGDISQLKYILISLSRRNYNKEDIRHVYETFYTPKKYIKEYMVCLER